MFYMCLFELILSLILRFPHWNLSYPMLKKTYTNICVPLLVFFITTSVFELTLSSVSSFSQCDFCCHLYKVHIPWCPVRVRLSSFWAWFWGFPTGIWAIPYTQKHTQTYLYLCWCSSSLHRYLSSLWALPWAFSNVIWAAAFTYYIYLDAYWCSICVCLSSFWAWFWSLPTGIWAIPCQRKWHKHTCSLVEVLHHYIDIRAHFELCLEPSPKWFELLPLHTTYTLLSYTCSFELILSFPHWNLSYPMHKKSYVNICVPLLVFFITTSVFELTLSSVLGFFHCDLSCCLYILHIPWCTLMSYICLFDSSFWAWFWICPTGIWAISCTKKHTSTYV